MLKFIRTIDYLSETIGKTFGWVVLVLTAGTCYEVFCRYVLDDPTDWAFDMSYMFYGAMFLMGGGLHAGQRRARSWRLYVSQVAAAYAG